MKDIHSEAMCWLRYGKRMPIVVTEAGPWHADVLGLCDKYSIEVEVKKSKSDLRAEFRTKRAKHYQYANAETQPAPFVPNYLYFFVPEAMSEYTVQVIQEQAPKAGVVTLTETDYLDGRNAQIIKKASRLRAEPPRAGFISMAVQRMSSELCGMMIANARLRRAFEDSIESLPQEVALATMRQVGALDMENVQEDLVTRAGELAFAVDGITDLRARPQEEQRRWVEAATRYLEGQYFNSKQWAVETYNFRSPYI